MEDSLEFTDLEQEEASVTLQLNENEVGMMFKLLSEYDIKGQLSVTQKIREALARLGK